MYSNMKRPTPEAVVYAEVLTGLEEYKESTKMADLYDVDEEFATLMNKIPGFEYPDLSYMTIKELRAYVKTRAAKSAAALVAAYELWDQLPPVEYEGKNIGLTTVDFHDFPAGSWGEDAALWVSLQHPDFVAEEAYAYLTAKKEAEAAKSV
ncbi:hypothetical protein YA0089_28005 [Pseudomonas viridiflava]|uniref:hypothetical protein n=1 Tax=Pseudomonas viridiflava TaxID=33069 RepID=UPI0018E6574A|nr:hypothetical protein [Pseudomonas viridiflava]MBI6727466.1 hypothetical protein [Pseudomonas viridiflava]